MAEVLAVVDVVGLLGGRPVGVAATAAVRAAAVVIGSAEQVASVEDLLDDGARRVAFGPGLAGLDAIDGGDGAGRVCVLASGDPGLFGIVGPLGRRVAPERLRVHPAPSSVSLAFARIGRPWDGAVVVSCHARPIPAVVEAVRTASVAAVLVAPDQPAEAVGAALVAAGAADRRVWVCTRVGEAAEAIVETDLAGLAAGRFDPRSVVVLIRSVDAPGPAADATGRRVAGGWGRDIDAFAHRDGMITKPEVRSAVLGRLALPERGVVWDLGAGSGSVAIEAALAAPGLRVVAVERRADDADRIRANAARLGAVVEVVVADVLDALDRLPAPDRVFVGGGGLDVLDAACTSVAADGVVVATFAAADRALAARARLGNLTQIAVSTTDVLPDGGVRFVADNPVFLTWGAPSSVARPAAAAPAPAPARPRDAPTGPVAVGVGCSTTASAADLLDLVEATLADLGLAVDDVEVVATVERRADHLAVAGLARALDRPVRAFAESELAAVEVPNPSAVVAAHLETASVAEAAALLAAGPDAVLVAAKRRSERATVAVAGPPRGRAEVGTGSLTVVGLGPGGSAHRTAAAVEALAAAEVVYGYGPYVDQCEAVLRPDQHRVRSGMGEEAARATDAVVAARGGARVAMVSSGDAGVFSMASVTLELAAELAPDLEVVVVPGVTAAHAGAALAGAPLAHDHAAISLSDRLTTWEAIAARISAAAATGFVLALYNPRSKARPWQLGAARDLVLAVRDPSTPVALVTDVGRAGERAELTTLVQLDVDAVGMNTVVLIGSADTAVLAGRLVTRRHHPRPSGEEAP